MEPARDLLAAAVDLQPETVELRRRLHRRPEVGLTLPETQAAVLAAIDGLPLQVTHRDRGHAPVVGVLEGGRPGPTVLLRGDMDALPMPEDTGLDFASEIDGVMHACGHDTHIAMLVGAAQLLWPRAGRAGRPGGVHVPARRGGLRRGAASCSTRACWTRPARPVDVRPFALHITPSMPSGVRRDPARAGDGLGRHAPDHGHRPGRARLRRRTARSTRSRSRARSCRRCRR